MTTQVNILLDRSGSMVSIKSDIVGGFNQFIDTLKKEMAGSPESVLVSFAQFDDGAPLEYVFKDMPLATVPELRPEQFRPRGLTPLIDAAMTMISHAEDRAGAGGTQTGRAKFCPECGRPTEPTSKVIFVILTDGCENCSHKFNRRQLQDKVGQLRARGWAFTFLGVGFDAYGEAGGYGISADQTVSVSPQSAGASFAMAGSSASDYAKTGIAKGFTRQQKAAVEDPKFAEKPEQDKAAS